MTNESHQQLHIVNRGRCHGEAVAEAREILATMIVEEEAAHEDWADDDFEDYYGPDSDPLLDLPEMDIIYHNCLEC